MQKQKEAEEAEKKRKEEEEARLKEEVSIGGVAIYSVLRDRILYTCIVFSFLFRLRLRKRRGKRKRKFLKRRGNLLDPCARWVGSIN